MKPVDVKSSTYIDRVATKNLNVNSRPFPGFQPIFCCFSRSLLHFSRSFLIVKKENGAKKGSNKDNIYSV